LPICASCGDGQSGNPFIYDVLDFNPVWQSVVLLLLIGFIIYPPVYLLLYYYAKWAKRYFQGLRPDSSEAEVPILGSKSREDTKSYDGV